MRSSAWVPSSSCSRTRRHRGLTVRTGPTAVRRAEAADQDDARSRRPSPRKAQHKRLDIAPEFQVFDLDDQRQQADIAPLGLDDAPRKVRGLANLDGSLVLAFSNPPSSADRNE